MLKIEVSGWILDFVKTGDAVIRQVTGYLTHGIGNQRTHLLKTEKEAGLRTYAAQQLYDSDPTRYRYMRMAAATIKFGAGACHEVAALAYCVLRETVDTSTPVCYVTSEHCEHAFATIGIPGVQGDDEVIVVDAWPTMAQAVRWKDHFCYGTKITIRQMKMGSAKSKLSRLVTKHFASLDAEAELERIRKDLESRGLGVSPKVYDQEWCSSTREWIDYRAAA
jgi:hypothetical protein